MYSIYYNVQLTLLSDAEMHLLQYSSAETYMKGIVSKIVYSHIVYELKH